MVTVGVIGLGHMGGYHASICASLPNMKLIGVADPVDEKLENIVLKSSVIKSHSYEDWIDKVEAVIIAVPTQYHYPIAKDCLQRGKHVLLEKPLTKTIKQAQELFAIAREKQLSLHVGHVERFNAAVQEIKKIVHEPYLIESHRIGPFTPRPQKDTVVLDLMIHDLDIILQIVNSPVKTVNVIGNNIKTDLADMACVQIQFENGVLANVVSSRASQIKKRSMSIHQHGSFVHLDFTTQDISIHTRTKDKFKIKNDQLEYKQKGTVQRLFVYKDNPLKLEIESFARSIITKSNLFDAEQDIQALQLAFQIEEMLGAHHDSNHRRSGQTALGGMQGATATE